MFSFVHIAFIVSVPSCYQRLTSMQHLRERNEAVFHAQKFCTLKWKLSDIFSAFQLCVTHKDRLFKIKLYKNLCNKHYLKH